MNSRRRKAVEQPQAWAVYCCCLGTMGTVISLYIIQYVAVLLSFFATVVFHYSWLLRCLSDCWPDCSDPAAILPVLLWLVSLDRVRDERCLIIAPASSWTSSKPEPVFLEKQSAVTFPNCIWFSLAQSLLFYPSFTLHPLISQFPFSYLLFNLSYWALGEHVFFLNPGMPYASQCITHSPWELPSVITSFYSWPLGAAKYRPVGASTLNK